MLTIRSLVLGLIATAALAVTAGNVAASDPLWPGPFSNHHAYPKYYSAGAYAFQSHKAPLPAFQAAPWYLYWPYDGHFLTPAPVTGAFYGPPTPGNFPVNPYFPGPGYGAGYGPLPGGVAPGYGGGYGPLPGGIAPGSGGGYGPLPGGGVPGSGGGYGPLPGGGVPRP